MKSNLLHMLEMRFNTYYEVYRESNNLEWKEVNREYMLKTWKEICELDEVKNNLNVRLNPNETDFDQMKFQINLINR